MGANPFREVFPRQRRGRQSQDYLFLLINRRQNFSPIENEKYFHRGVSDSLVAVDKWVIGDKREAEGGGLLFERRVQLGIVE